MTVATAKKLGQGGKPTGCRFRTGEPNSCGDKDRADL